MAELTVKQIGSHILLTLENDALTEKEREKILSMGGEDEQEELEALLEEAQAAARPKMVFQVSSIDEKGDDFVIIEGIKVVSPLMRKNFDKVNRVFPFVASCGTELEKWAEGRPSISAARNPLCSCIQHLSFAGTTGDTQGPQDARWGTG